MRRSHRKVVEKHEELDYTYSEFYTISHTYYNQDLYMDEHWHNSIEIDYVIHGNKRMKIDGEQREYSDGDVNLVNSEVLHDVKVYKGFEGFVILIDRTYIDQTCPEAKGKNFNIYKSEEIYQSLRTMVKELIEAEGKKNTIRCQILILQIIELLTDQMLDDSYVPNLQKDVQSQLVYQMIKYINNNYMNDISLEEIANSLNYNKAYISNLFKIKKGITLFEYLNNVRMEHALNDLKNTNMKIVEIANNNGFSNIQVFNRKFKQLYNMTPKQYRNKV